MPDFKLERAAGGRVAGVDEVGRGPLSGPVLAAAVVFPTGVPRKLAALRCHRTQMGRHNPIAWIDEEEARHLLGTEYFRRGDEVAGDVLEQLGDRYATRDA